MEVLTVDTKLLDKDLILVSKNKRRSILATFTGELVILPLKVFLFEKVVP